MAGRRAGLPSQMECTTVAACKTCYPSRAVPDRVPRIVLPLALAIAAGTAGCGRRATHEDCQLIVDRSVELEMRQTSETNPQAIAKREAEVRAALDGEIKSCERDRRVTEKTMACVRSASTTQELDSCLH
jgi:hypothetical protein